MVDIIKSFVSPSFVFSFYFFFPFRKNLQVSGGKFMIMVYVSEHVLCSAGI